METLYSGLMTEDSSAFNTLGQSSCHGIIIIMQLLSLSDLTISRFNSLLIYILLKF